MSAPAAPHGPDLRSLDEPPARPDLRALEEALAARLDADAEAWLGGARARVAGEPAAIRALFPAVGRRTGRGPLHDGPGLAGWTIDDAARTVLLVALPSSTLDAEVDDLYRHGDAAERRAVLRALPLLDGLDATAATRLVTDALRTNDLRLVAAALGPWAVAHLDDATLAQAVLKCVFVGVPIAAVGGLVRRATPELSRMLAGYVHERVAAGRAVPGEVWALIDVHPPEAELAAIRAELDSPVSDRAAAARAALDAALQSRS